MLPSCQMPRQLLRPPAARRQLLSSLLSAQHSPQELLPVPYLLIFSEYLPSDIRHQRSQVVAHATARTANFGILSKPRQPVHCMTVADNAQASLTQAIEQRRWRRRPP